MYDISPSWLQFMLLQVIGRQKITYVWIHQGLITTCESYRSKSKWDLLSPQDIVLLLYLCSGWCKFQLSNIQPYSLGSSVQYLTPFG